VRMFSPDPPLISSLVTGLKRRLKCQVLAEWKLDDINARFKQSAW
jgi:hypothetical protein